MEINIIMDGIIEALKKKYSEFKFCHYYETISDDYYICVNDRELFRSESYQNTVQDILINDLWEKNIYNVNFTYIESDLLKEECSETKKDNTHESIIFNDIFSNMAMNTLNFDYFESLKTYRILSEVSLWENILYNKTNNYLDFFNNNINYHFLTHSFKIFSDEITIPQIPSFYGKSLNIYNKTISEMNIDENNEYSLAA